MIQLSKPIWLNLSNNLGVSTDWKINVNLLFYVFKLPVIKPITNWHIISHVGYIIVELNSSQSVTRVRQGSVRTLLHSRLNPETDFHDLGKLFVGVWLFAP